MKNLFPELGQKEFLAPSVYLDSRFRGKIFRGFFLALFFRQFGAFTFRETVAEGAEPAIKGNRAFTVVTLEVPVVKIVEIGACREFAVQDRTFKAVVAPGRPQRGVL